MAIATMAAHPIGLIALIILARLLDPSDFGIVALAMLVFSTMRLFSDLGTSSALIHSPFDRKEISFPAFLITALVSLSLCGVVNLSPGLLAGFLGNQEVIPILRGLSILIVLDALSVTPEAILRKELMFGRISRVMLLSNILDNVIGVTCAFFGFGLWSLVYGKLGGATVQLILIWLVCPGWDWLIPPKQWEWGKVRQLLAFGMGSTGGGLVNFFNSHWDDWLVGRTLGATALGFYDKAYGLTNNTIAGLNRSVISAVLFPSYAKIQNEKERLAKAYIKGLSISAMVMAPLAMGVLAVADELVPLVFGEKWIAMIPALQIFAFMALARPMAGTTSPLFRALGRPDYDFRAGLVVGVIMVPMALLLLDRGIEGVAVAVTVSYICGFFYNIYQVQRLLPEAAAQMIPAVLPAVIASAVMVAGVYLVETPLQQLAGGHHTILSLGLLILCGAVLYLGMTFLMQRSLVLELADLTRAIFRKKKTRLALN